MLSSRRVCALLLSARGGRAGLSAQAHAVPLEVVTPLRLIAETNRRRRRGDTGSALSMVTAHNVSSARQVSLAGHDLILVGDSLGMVEMGHDDTLAVSVDDMLHHCRAAARGVASAREAMLRRHWAEGVCGRVPLLVGDMPFGSYEDGPSLALQNALRFIKEAGCGAVKLEGAGGGRVESVRKIVQSGGIAVMGHIGLTPQSVGVLGGFRAQGRTAVKARQLLDDALALQEAGAFAVVIECVPPNVAKYITDALRIPTIGIGSGPHCSGQVLVYADLLGMMAHPHHEHFAPRFCKQYAQLGKIANSALEEFREDVLSGRFPDESYSPYTMSDKELEKFDDMLRADEEARLREQKETETRLRQADEYDVANLYPSSATQEKEGE